MALNSINTNIAAYSAQANIGKASNSASASIARLSSGNRITKASDDVAALSIGTSLRTGVTTLKTALNNASQGSSLLQVADGALSQISEILQRQKAIATQAGSGSLGATERGFLNQEFQNLTAEIDRISNTTNFNGVKLINGGLGTTTSLASTDAQAAAFTATATASDNGTADASTKAIQAFDTTDGTTRGTAAAGDVQIVDSANAALVGAAFNTVNTSLSGKIESVKLTDVTYGASTAGSATLTVKIGGVEYSGRINGNTAAQSINLTNGNTTLRFSLGTTAALGVQDYTNSATANLSEQNFFDAFRTISFQRTVSIDGVDFSGTRLEGAVGIAGTGIASARLNSNTAVISNFQYGGNTGAADTNRLTVDINGTTFTATGVDDAIDTAAGKIVFQSDDGQMLSIDLTGLDIDFTATDNIRLNASTRDQFLNALNVGFSRAGTGLSFQVGSTADDSLKVSLSSANSASLYNGASLGVSTAEDSAVSVAALDKAIQKVTSLRADVGATQSRFNFASANLETSIQNQDAARGALLDTDVSGESTAYATAQVQLQAGIAVLAQANQLPQNLLKLIS
jgi:flagellin